MGAIDDLISRIEDTALRERLLNEFRLLTREKKFGLVFEEHIPEITPIYDAEVERNSTVIRLGDPTSTLWRVISKGQGKAKCVSKSSGEHEEIPLKELVPIRSFGEPIFPSLVRMDGVQNAGAEDPWHVLVEADNYHALQLLEYLYTGQVDCIYIDPPYNTGARDWKYNNDFVDVNDRWRHSKWLAMMKRRLTIAKRLLKPEKSFLVVTIDEHEVNHLGCLLEDLFPGVRMQMVTIVNNAAGVSQGGFHRVEEYAWFVFLGSASPTPIEDDLLSNEEKAKATPIWFSLIRYGGINALPSKRPGLVYPIGIDPASLRIVGAGPTLKDRAARGEISGNLDGWRPDPEETVQGCPVVWPYRSNGSLSTWQLMPEKLVGLASEGFVRVREQSKGPGGNQWSISYVKSSNQEKIRSGEIPVLGRQEGGGPLILGNVTRTVIPKTVWRRAKHDAGKWGSRTIRELLGNVNFDYAKSPYAVLDTLDALVGNNPNALVLDFFAGSGTTLHALLLLNARDHGRRQCILVTNNEVSEKDASWLSKEGARPGTARWEDYGVCRSVTWPRSKASILGKRADGTKLEGNYTLGNGRTREVPRRFVHLPFIPQGTLSTVAKKKALMGITKDLPGSALTQDCSFVVSDLHTSSILFDVSAEDDWIEALEGQDHITDFYIVTENRSEYNEIRRSVEELLGPVTVTEEELRPMSQGFSTNLEYFKLDFLDRDQLALGRRGCELLPILWLRSGAIGPCPRVAGRKGMPDMLLPRRNRFALLADESRFAKFREELRKREDITHVFLVTDSEDAFHEMASQVNATHVVQLYRDYLENFLINKE